MHNEDTWAICHELIQEFACFCARSNLAEKLDAASWSQQDNTPEMQTRICVDSNNQIKVTAAPIKLNEKIEIVMMHCVQLVLHRLLYLVSKDRKAKTNSLYRVGAREMPFLNTRLRDRGLCTAYSPEFIFERLFLGPKTYISRHGARWTHRQLKRLTRHQLQILFRASRGYSEAHNTGRPSRSTREFFTGCIVRRKTSNLEYIQKDHEHDFSTPTTYNIVATEILHVVKPAARPSSI